jgi:hypothetical protein
MPSRFSRRVMVFAPFPGVVVFGKTDFQAKQAMA